MKQGKSGTAGHGEIGRILMWTLRGAGSGGRRLDLKQRTAMAWALQKQRRLGSQRGATRGEEKEDSKAQLDGGAHL